MSFIVAFILYILEMAKMYMGNIMLYDEGEKAKKSLIYMIIISSILLGLMETKNRELVVYILGIAGGWFFTKGTVVERLKRWISLVIILSSMDMMAGILIQDRWNTGVQNITGATITFSILLGMQSIKKMLNAKEDFFFKVRDIFQFIMLLLCLSLALGVTAIRKWYSYLPKQIGYLNYEFALAISFASIVILILFTLYAGKLNQRLEEKAMVEKELRKLEKQHYTVLLEKEEETRKYRHDVSNHMACMYTMAERGDISRLKSYLETMEENLLRIRGRSFFTGIEILDIMLSTYLSNLTDVEIQVEGKCSNKIILDDVNSCIIFSNLIQNAVEEVKRQKQGRKKIRVYIESGKSYTKISIQNSLSESKADKLLSLETKKTDRHNHGIGLKNVQKVLEESKGSLNIEKEEEMFKVTVLIPNIIVGKGD